MEREHLTPQELYQERAFDAKAESYDHQTASLGDRDNRNHAIKAAAIDEMLALSDGDRVLEIGIGSGLHADRLLRAHPEVRYTGIDISSRLVALTSERLSSYGNKVTVKQDNANDLSFLNDTFDAVFCAATLHHMEKPGNTVAEMARVLRHGGRLVIMEPNWLYPTNWIFMLLLEEDRNMFLMRRRNLLHWMREAGLSECNVRNLLYTPPKPEFLLPLFDRIDAAAAKIPGLRNVSLMLACLGIKQDG